MNTEQGTTANESETAEDASDTLRPNEVDDPQSYEHVASVDDVPQMRPRLVDVNGHGLLLCMKDGEVRALDEICPHKQLSMRHGFIQGGALICPHHQYKFDVETGRCRKHRCEPAETFEVHVENGEVYVKLQGKLTSPGAGTNVPR